MSGWTISYDTQFWGKDTLPDKVWIYYLDIGTIDVAAYDMLKFLSKLNIIEFGCFYDHFEMIRIKLR